MNIKTIISGSICCALALTLMFSFSPETETVANTKASTDLEQARAVNKKMYEQPYKETKVELAIPYSLIGTDYKASFKQDAQKTLLPTYEIRDLFDHYLTAYGEADLDDIIALIQTEIAEHLEEPARSQAYDLLKRYIDYKISLAEMNQNNSDGVTHSPLTNTSLSDNREAYLYSLELTLRDVEDMRAQFFSAQEYEEFFALEDAQSRFLIEQIRINSDPSLDLAEKQQRLSELEQASLPAEIIEQRARVQQHATLRETVKQLKTEGADAQEIYRVREANLGAEAAEALAKLDEERQQWKERVATFSRDRETVLSSAMSESDKNASITQLLNEQFKPHEQKRVKALLGAS